MAGLTQAQAEAQLALWITASEKVAQGQSYTIGSRSLTRADAKDIQDMITFWNGHVQRLAGGGTGRTRGLTLG